MMKRIYRLAPSWLFGLLISTSIVTAQIPNQLVTEWKDGSATLSSPSVAINPEDPQQIVITTSGKRLFTTIDGGKTWTESVSQDDKESGGASVYFDDKGRLVRLHETNSKKATGGTFDVVAQAADGTQKPWSRSYSLAGESPKDHRGVQASIGPKKNEIHAVWTQYDQYGLADPNALSLVMYSVSTNGGTKWSKPVQINKTPGDCKDENNSARGVSIAAGMEGRIFLAWVNQGLIFLDRSYNNGDTWLSNDLAVTKQPVGSQLAIPGTQGVTGFPTIKVDISPRRTNGSLYLVFSDQRNGANDTDIWFVRSTNRGDLWAPPLRVNQDEPGKHQFSPAMAFDPVNGNIFIAYFDRRDHDDLKTDVYLAGSTDGGNSFREFKISEIPFIADEKSFQGNNLALVAHGGTLVPVWIRIDGGKASLWTAVFKSEELNKK